MLILGQGAILQLVSFALQKCDERKPLASGGRQFAATQSSLHSKQTSCSAVGRDVGQSLAASERRVRRGMTRRTESQGAQGRMERETIQSHTPVKQPANGYRFERVACYVATPLEQKRDSAVNNPLLSGRNARVFWLNRSAPTRRTLRVKEL